MGHCRRWEPGVEPEVLANLQPCLFRGLATEHHLDRPAGNKLRTTALNNVYLVVKTGSRKQRRDDILFVRACEHGTDLKGG